MHGSAGTVLEDVIIATEEGVTIIEDPELDYVYDTIEIFTGNNQLGEMLKPLANPLIVRVSD